MSRRTSERYARRVEVRFWRRGQTQPHSGYTVDLSKTGLFLGTSISLEPGERVRLEVLDRERGFIVEGTVARVHRVSLALRHVEQAGVGVRFLTPGELVGDLVSGSKPRVVTSAATRVQRRPFPEAEPGGAAAPRTEDPETTSNDADALFGSPAGGAEPAAGAHSAPANAGPSQPARTVPVEFVDRGSFLAVYHRDIEAGGLFVTSDLPADLHEVLLIELRPPIPTQHPLRFEARVVQRFDRTASEGKPGLTGMGVQFLDPDRVRATLAPVLAQLRR